MLEIYLGAHAGGWAAGGRRQRWSPHASPAAGLSELAHEVAAQHARRWRSTPVALWLSGALARPFVCGPVAGLRRWPEAQALAASLVREATGFDEACTVVLESWPGRDAALATAVPTELLDLVADLARELRISWSGVRPWWSACLDDALRERPGLRLIAIEEGDSTTVLAGAGAFESAFTYTPNPAPESFAAIWHRALLARDLAAEDTLHVRLDAEAPVAADRVWPGRGGAVLGESREGVSA